MSDSLSPSKNPMKRRSYRTCLSVNPESKCDCYAADEQWVCSFSAPMAYITNFLSGTPRIVFQMERRHDSCRLKFYCAAPIPRHRGSPLLLPRTVRAGRNTLQPYC